MCVHIFMFEDTESTLHTYVQHLDYPWVPTISYIVRGLSTLFTSPDSNSSSAFSRCEICNVQIQKLWLLSNSTALSLTLKPQIEWYIYVGGISKSESNFYQIKCPSLCEMKHLNMDMNHSKDVWWWWWWWSFPSHPKYVAFYGWCQTVYFYYLIKIR